MGESNRNRRVSGRVQQIVARILESRIKDPRLGFVTITDVRMSGDLQHATVFYTVIGDDTQRAASAAALQSATGIIRSEVGKGIGLRLTPTLEFIEDALPTTAQDIEDALAKARVADEELARMRRNAPYAGDPDPYRHDEEYQEDNAEEDEY